jgi:hypothetical protein
MDFKDLAISYLETWALQQLSKEQLIEKVQSLQKRDKELVDFMMKTRQSITEKDKKIRELKKVLTDTQVKSAEYELIADLKLGYEYNVNATWIDKIVFVLRAAERPLPSSEIIYILLRNDIMFRNLADPQKGLSAHLTRAMKYGRIIGVKQKGQNGYLFSLPEDSYNK